jgi:hypothetical protein
VGIERHAVRARELAEAVAKNPHTVSRWLQRATGRWREVPLFVDLVEKLCAGSASRAAEGQR